MSIPTVAARLSRSLSTAQRAGEVVSALAGFGFSELVLQTGLARYLPKRDDPEHASARDEPLPVRVRLLLEELGPTFVKVGQIMSTRPDLIPDEWIDELRKLQSNVPPEAWEGDDGVRAVLENEEGDLDEAFASIETEAFAAASMAQVHRAVLHSGEKVVLKVLRPGIRDLIESDLELMRLFARLTKSHFANLGFDAEAVVAEFGGQLARETDLLLEASSTRRMRNDFEDDEDISFPRVYEEYSTRSVLVLEEVHGTLLTKLDPTTLTNEQRERIVQNGANMVFRQCLIIGFFHADPHPGNIFVLEGERLCFIDCGMTGLIDPGTITTLAHIVHGAISGDLDRVVKSAIQLSDADPSIGDDRGFRADVWQFVDRFRGGSIESIQMGVLLNDFFAILREYRLRCPADIVYLIKALTTIEGVAGSIAPSFDLVSYARPYLEQLIRQRYSVGAMRRRVEGALQAYGDLIEELPGEISDLMRAIKQNRLALQLDHKGLDKVTSEIERASMNISWSLVIASLMVGASVLILADNIDRDSSFLTIIATAVFVVSITIGVLRLMRLRFGQWRRNRKERRGK